MGYSKDQPVALFSKHLGAVSEAMALWQGTSQVYNA